MATNSLLKKVLIRIDFLQVQDMDVENAIQKVRSDFFDKKFKLFQGVVPFIIHQQNEVIYGNTNVNTPIETITENIKEFQFRKENFNIKVSCRYLILEDFSTNIHAKTDIYMEIIEKLITEMLVENPYLQFQRIGLRKIHSIVFKDIINLDHYFEKEIFNQKTIMESLENFETTISNASSNISLLLNGKDKVNIITDIQTGEYHNLIGEVGQAIQIILDIDMYNDSLNGSGDGCQYIIDKYNDLDKESNDIYKASLTECFYTSLETGEINDSNILGGVCDAI